MNPYLRLALLGVFFLTGCCALVYQVLWTRLFTLSLGATAYSLCAVLCAFMGGLAVGSSLASRLVDRKRDFLTVYFLLELGIALFALLSPAFMDLVFGLVAVNLAGAAIPFGLGVLLRSGLCFALLLVPTTLMGATLPVLARGFVQNEHDTGRDVATLYFVNTLGGAAGAFLCGFVLIRTFGIHNSLAGTACLNILLAVAVFVLRAWFGIPCADRFERAARPPVHLPDLDRRLLLPLIGLSGFMALSYEILWTRVLTFFVGWTVYSYTIMLTTFLLGLALGSAAYAVLIRNRFNSVSVLAFLQIGTGLFATLSIPLFGLLDPLLTWALDSGFGSTSRQHMGLLFLASSMIMPPATTLLGATFSAAVQAGRTDLGRVAGTVGSLLAANTVGNLLGAVGATFVLIPLLGDAREAVLLVAVGHVLMGAALMAFGRKKIQTRSRRWAIAIATLSVAVASLCMPSGPVLAQTYLYRRVLKNPKILFNRTGVTSTVAVVEEGDKAAARLLMINNLEVASAGSRIGGSSYHSLISYFGMLLHPDPRDVFVVGLASGQTATAVLDFGEVRSLETVELSGEVIEALAYFDGPVPRLIADARSSLIREDARIYLLGSPKMYDVIISDVLLSATTGTTHLLSQEFFAICRRHLKPGGLMVLEWTPQGGSIAPLILRTFSSVFPTVVLYRTPAPDSPSMFVVGSETPIGSDIRAMNRRLESEIVGSAFSAGGVETGDGLLRLRVETTDVVANLETYPVVTDDKPLIDFMLERMVNYRGATTRAHTGPSP